MVSETDLICLRMLDDVSSTIFPFVFLFLNSVGFIFDLLDEFGYLLTRLTMLAASLTWFMRSWEELALCMPIDSFLSSFLNHECEIDKIGRCNVQA